MFMIAAVALMLGYLMLLWLKTDAFAEYMNLFRLNKWLHIDEYNQLHQEGYSGNYPDFLFEYYRDKFIVRLVTCPLCLSFWTGLFAALYVDSFSGILCAPLILFSYLLFNKML
jgi:hypothetical protein